MYQYVVLNSLLLQYITKEQIDVIALHVQGSFI